MASFVRSFQQYMPSSLPFQSGANYQNLPDQSQPLYHPTPPMPQNAYQQQPTAYDPKHPMYNDKQTRPCSPSINKARRKYSSYRRYLKIVVFVSNIFSAVLSGLMLMVMVCMVIFYNQTKNKTEYSPRNHGDVTPWPKDPKLWPTYMLLVSAGMTFLGALFALLRFCISRKSRAVFKIVFYFLHIVVWVVVTVMFRVGKTGDDLWGWSCQMVGGERAELFKDILNFDTLCKAQGSSWNACIAESGWKILWTLVGWLYSKRISKIQGRIVGEMGGMGDLDI